MEAEAKHFKILVEKSRGKGTPWRELGSGQRAIGIVRRTRRWKSLERFVEAKAANGRSAGVRIEDVSAPDRVGVVVSEREDVALVDMVHRIDPEAPLFYLDTDFLFPKHSRCATALCANGRSPLRWFV